MTSRARLLQIVANARGLWTATEEAAFAMLAAEEPGLADAR
jgi:hypothetical protein